MRLCGFLLVVLVVTFCAVSTPFIILDRVRCQNQAEFAGFEWQWHFSTGCMMRMKPMATEKAR